MEDYGVVYCSSKRSGQIPVFGHWEYADELPITQYFENARQAGLPNRYSSSSGECGGRGDGDGWNGPRDDGDGRKVQTRPTNHPKKHPVRRSTATARHAPTPQDNRCCYARIIADAVSTYPHPRVVRAAKGTTKPIDEDLYKIPPELLHNTKRKKMLGFFSRCLVPGCAA